MNDSNGIDFSTLQPLDTGSARALHARIVNRLGEPPRRLPGMVQLRIERIALPSALISSAILLIGLVASRVEDPPIERAMPAEQRILDVAAEGPLAARDAYQIMRGL